MLFTMPSWKQVNPPYKFKWTEKIVLVSEGRSETIIKGYMENYKNVSQDIRDQLNAEAEVVQIILTGIDNDIYSTVDAYLETNLYWEFGKFTSRDGESLESYYSRFYKMMNELVRNQCDVTNHQVNVQFLLQLQLERQRFVTLIKHSQELKNVSYHKLYDILKQHQTELNEIRAERLARTANPLALVAQQQPVYHPQNHPTHYTNNSSTRSQQAATRNRDDEMSKDKEIDKLMDLISLSFKKIYKPTNNNLKTSSNNSRANQDNTLRINRGTGYDNQRVVNVVGARDNVGTQVVQQSRIQCYNCKEYGHVARECQKLKRAKDAAYHKDKMLLSYYMCMAQIQEVTLDAADNSGPIFDAEPLQKVQNNDDNYNVFAIENEHPKQPASVNDIYLEEQGDINITIDSLDMCNNGETIDQDNDDLAKERDLLASLIEKLKCEIDDNKNRNKFLDTSNKALVDKLKCEIKDFKTKNKSLESSNNRFKEANNELSKTNQLMFKDLKKFQAELDRYHDGNYASKVAIDCAKAKGDLMSYKMESKKSFSEYTRKINNLNQTILEMKRDLFAHQETISIMSQEKEAQIKFYKTCEDKEIEKVIALENKDLKAQLHDKGIALSELKKLIEKMKGKSVETKFEKSSVIRQPNAFKSLRQSILGKLATFSDSLAKTDFSKSKSVTTNNMSNDFSKPVTAQNLPQNVMSILKNTNVIAPGMYKVHTKPNQTRTPQLPQDIRKTNKRVSFSTGVIPTTNVSRPQLKSNQLEDRKCFVNSRTKMPMAVPISTREHKRTMNQSVATTLNRIVASESTNHKPRHTIRKLYEHVSKTCSWWYPKFTPSGYKWKPKSQIGNVNTNVSMPLGNASRTTNILEPGNGYPTKGRKNKAKNEKTEHGMEKREKTKSTKSTPTKSMQKSKKWFSETFKEMYWCKGVCLGFINDEVELENMEEEDVGGGGESIGPRIDESVADLNKVSGISVSASGIALLSSAYCCVASIISERKSKASLLLSDEFLMSLTYSNFCSQVISQVYRELANGGTCAHTYVVVSV
ncbi:retrovirus-related pol polyprotein from transposon TNT 1-94 [Tanacetum coccineum]